MNKIDKAQLVAYLSRCSREELTEKSYQVDAIVKKAGNMINESAFIDWYSD